MSADHHHHNNENIKTNIFRQALSKDVDICNSIVAYPLFDETKFLFMFVVR